MKNKRGKTTETDDQVENTTLISDTMTVKRNESGGEGAGQIKNQSRHRTSRIYSM